MRQGKAKDRYKYKGRAKKSLSDSCRGIEKRGELL